MMGEKTLFLAWQDRGSSRRWFPVGRLDADVEGPSYRFRYTGGAKLAKEATGFAPLASFPRLDEDYRSARLFSLFGNRVMWPSRPEFKDYLKSLDLSESNDPIDMLAVSGGNRVTDSYEVFPKLVKNSDGDFVCRFFLHGGRHVASSAQERSASLRENEELHLALELTNPVGEPAVQIQTIDYHMIGWSPRYLAHDLSQALAGPLGFCRARVVLINKPPILSEQRVLIEMSGNLGDHEPMTGQEFMPLID